MKSCMHSGFFTFYPVFIYIVSSDIIDLFLNNKANCSPAMEIPTPAATRSPPEKVAIVKPFLVIRSSIIPVKICPVKDRSVSLNEGILGTVTLKSKTVITPNVPPR